MLLSGICFINLQLSPNVILFNNSLNEVPVCVCVCVERQHLQRFYFLCCSLLNSSFLVTSIPKGLFIKFSHASCCEFSILLQKGYFPQLIHFIYLFPLVFFNFYRYSRRFCVFFFNFQFNNLCIIFKCKFIHSIQHDFNNIIYIRLFGWAYAIR